MKPTAKDRRQARMTACINECVDWLHVRAHVCVCGFKCMYAFHIFCFLFKVQVEMLAKNSRSIVCIKNKKKFAQAIHHHQENHTWCNQASAGMLTLFIL